MKPNNLEEAVYNYFEKENNLNTDELISRLKPVITQKCEKINSDKKDYLGFMIFALCCVATFVGGIIVLFPEMIDFTDTIMQFVILGLATVFTLAAINLVIRSLLPNSINNSNIKLRGKLS